MGTSLLNMHFAKLTPEKQNPRRMTNSRSYSWYIWAKLDFCSNFVIGAAPITDIQSVISEMVSKFWNLRVIIGIICLNWNEESYVCIFSKIVSKLWKLKEIIVFLLWLDYISQLIWRELCVCVCTHMYTLFCLRWLSSKIILLISQRMNFKGRDHIEFYSLPKN